jgi:hypothetical protein
MVADGQVMPAGTAVHKGYITYAELKAMFPAIQAPSVAPAANKTLLRHTGKSAERTFISRWGLYGLTDSGRKSHYPYWTALKDKDRVRDHIKNYLKVEERRTTFKVVIDDDREILLKCIDQQCANYGAAS